METTEKYNHTSHETRSRYWEKKIGILQIRGKATSAKKSKKRNRLGMNLRD